MAAVEGTGTGVKKYPSGIRTREGAVLRGNIRKKGGKWQN